MTSHGERLGSFWYRSGLWLLLVVLSLAWAGISPVDRRHATTQFRLVAGVETCPYSPVISLRRFDNATSASHTEADAILHYNGGHRPIFPGGLDWDFFDACGRQLDPTLGRDGSVLDLVVASDENHAEAILERVRGRSQHVRMVLDSEVWPLVCKKCGDPVLTLTERAIPFEEFAGQLAAYLWLCGPPHGCHPAGWWHNVFGH